MKRNLRLRCAQAGAGVAVVLLAACGSGTTGPVSSVRAASAVGVAVPAADRFVPFIAEIQRGSLVIFHNKDKDAHTVVSIPGDGLALDLTLAPGQSETVTLGVGGVHRYFCSIHAHWDAGTGEVAANPNADRPAEPMQGVLVVT